jgi:predicted CoA-binding protein
MVARYLIKAGFTVIPVNPGQKTILERTCYSSLDEIPVAVDLVDIFRRAEDVLPIVESAVKIGVKAVWMQQGIINDEAASYAKEHGLKVTMDRCIKVDHQNLLTTPS